MAKKNKKTGGKRSPKNPKNARDKEEMKDDVVEQQEELTWEAIAAMSDSDDEDGDNAALELNSKAQNLKKDIAGGKFKGLLSSLQKATSAGDNDDGEEFEEDVLESSSDEDDEEGQDTGKRMDGTQEMEPSGSDDDDEEEKEDDEEEEDNGVINDDLEDGNQNDEDDEDMESGDDGGDDDEDQDETDEQQEKYYRLQKYNNANSKALVVVTQQLAAEHSKLPWAETFVVVPPTPLPFGEHGDPESNPLDIHDDLKREVAFYNTTLEAVHEARANCKDAGVPFSRPEDFFAEMVKTDDHMAKVKDRLIFENKKIEAVAQRRSNKEQKLRAKESHSNRLMEKAKRKRDHFQQVEEWANSAANNRGGALRDDLDKRFLDNRGGPSKKRQAADRKFGHGGKKGRFKQNDRQSMNDMSGFNPRGNFAGGMKKTSTKGKGGAGAARSGKRARDAKRARRS